MFDFMMHSCDGLSGLGDDGWSGINTFVKQHTCNSICKALNLPSTQSLWKALGPGAQEEDGSVDGDFKGGDDDSDGAAPSTHPSSSRSNVSMDLFHDYQDEEDN